MRRYNIVSGILLILSVIDFALAAPVLVQEKRQASVDGVHIPRDAITVLGKRGNAELEKLLDEYFKAMGKQVGASDTHVLSSSAPNPVWSTANPNPFKFMGPWSFKPSPITSSIKSDSKYRWLFKPNGDNSIQFSQPNPKIRPWTDMKPDPDFGMDNRLANVKRPSVPKRIKIAKTSGQQEEDVQRPDPGLWILDSGLKYFPATASAMHPVESTGAEPQASSELTDLELRLGHGSSSTMDSKPADLQAAIHAAKGKAKESRHISGTTRDVGNMDQRELQPDERSLDSGE